MEVKKDTKNEPKPLKLFFDFLKEIEIVRGT